MTDNGFYSIDYVEENNQVRVELHSKSDEIRAVELLDYIMHNVALVKGDRHDAVAVISAGILKSIAVSDELYTIDEYLQKKCDDYFVMVDTIKAEEYAANNESKIRRLPVYAKKDVMWAVVKTTDIMEEGTEFIVKSLENTTGHRMRAEKDSYIMIGIKGEVYDITAEKFEKTYEMTDEDFDMFEQMVTYIPEIQNCMDGKYTAIDNVAKICRPKPDNRIYAKKLARRTKVFGCGGREDYFLGHKDDYMAVRTDDIKDIYIINKEIFEETYVKCGHNDV